MRRREQLRAIRHRVRSTRSGRLTLQIIVGVVGGLLVLLGLALIPLPGPGWLIVLAGLAVLAAEFVWAKRLLEYTKRRLEQWWHWLGRQHILVRILAGLIGLVFVATVAWLTLRYSFGVKLADLWDYITSN